MTVTSATSQDLPTFPFEEDHAADSAPEFARLRATGRQVHRVRLPDGQTAWLPLNYEDVKTVLSDPRFSRVEAIKPGAPSVGPATNLPGMLVCLDGKEHARVRKLVARAFSARNTTEKRPRVEAIVAELLDDLERHGGPVDLIKHFAQALPLRVITEALGIPFEDRERFLHLSHASLNVVPDDGETMQAVMTELYGYFTELVERKRREPGEDLVTSMVEAHEDGGRLSQQELLANILLMLMAGHHTTQGHIVNGLLALFRHPDQLQLLRERLDLVPQAVEELMRYVQLETSGLIRIATADVQLSDTLVRAGEAVMPMLHPANRDPSVFPEPERLDILREDPRPQLSFGHGPHYCPGAALARMELQIALAALLTRFPGLRLAVPESELHFPSGLMMRALTELPVEW
jgi:cytochrome P450